jgi:RNA polymerase sigma-70 factor (ECF subfamily)
MSDNPSFRILIQQAIAGEDDAAAQIVENHTDALVRVARQRIGNKLGQRVDAEDVLQSVYRSFFGRLQEGQYELQTGRDLWNLLVRMTLNKICRQATYHQRQKRDMGQEQVAGQSSVEVPLANLARGDEPDPQDAVLLVETVEKLMNSLKPEDRPIIELRLQGYKTPEIAQQTGRAERSIRRIFERLKEKLERAILLDDFMSGPAS